MAPVFERSKSSRLGFLRLLLVIAASGLVSQGLALGDDNNVPTGLPPSPTFGIQKFTQPMPRLDLLSRNDPSTLNPAPTEQANTTQHAVDPALGGGFGPIEGRPPGPIWAHQGFTRFPPKIAVEVTMEGAKVNNAYNPGVPSSLNSGINQATPVHPRFAPGLPDQGPLALWTFNGTLPPKLLIARYAEPVLFRAQPAPGRQEPERRLRDQLHLHARAQRPPRR